jgi:hypothetical protein
MERHVIITLGMPVRPSATIHPAIFEWMQRFMIRRVKAFIKSLG